MAHPKRRQSKTRTLKRRTHDKAVAPTLAVCPNCGAYYVYTPPEKMIFTFFALASANSARLFSIV